MTDPAGTVMLDAVGDRADRQARAVIASSRPPACWLTTSGTATCGRPDETTSATALPMTTSAPARDSG